ncbi:hypothetical protein BH10PSE16_BH10PSE16_18810 [soil metagenome]
MKRLFLVSSLACAALLLSACPDTKLPTPAPRVPEPKAESTSLEGSPSSHSLAALGQITGGVMAASRS